MHNKFFCISKVKLPHKATELHLRPKKVASSHSQVHKYSYQNTNYPLESKITLSIIKSDGLSSDFCSSSSKSVH